MREQASPDVKARYRCQVDHRREGDLFGCGASGGGGSRQGGWAGGACRACCRPARCLTGSSSGCSRECAPPLQRPRQQKEKGNGNPVRQPRLVWGGGRRGGRGAAVFRRDCSCGAHQAQGCQHPDGRTELRGCAPVVEEVGRLAPAVGQDSTRDFRGSCVGGSA